MIKEKENIKKAEKQLIKGNHAIAQAAIIAGCQSYFGYPITPQSEIGEYLSSRMPALNRAFVCAESEVAAINMLIGAGATGVKAMTSSSSCAIALMQEGLSFLAADEIPCVVISVMRAGPGLGYIFPSQSDYTQAVKGGGNGDYRTITLAPSSVQECIDLTYKCFYLSQKYRNPVFLLADGLLGQMMEPVVFNEYPYEEIDTSSWSLDGAKNREPRCLKSIVKTPEQSGAKVNKLFKKYELIQQNEVCYEEFMTEDADLLITAFGSTARIAKAAIKKAREKGIKVGLFRPISLYPFPENELKYLALKTKTVLDIELNMGQMLQDVKAAINSQTKVKFYGRPAGNVMTVEEIYEQIELTYNEINEG